MSGRKLLNVGCGTRIHSEWTNLDLVPQAPGVLAHDIRASLPFDDNSFHAVYHSHLLEHLDPAAAERFLCECYRVLKPGGILRIVVPDLERIARDYLDAIERADAGLAGARDDHRWMVVELLDQMVRTRSGGQMARLFADQGLPNRGFVQKRMGAEMPAAAGDTGQPRGRLWKIRREALRLVSNARRGCAVALIWLLEGSRGCAAYRESLFRQQGEIHRWMYDRLSLRQLLEQTGYTDTRVCDVDESQLKGFPDFQLDAVGGQPLKPDSIFIEARKPASSAAKQRAA